MPSLLRSLAALPLLAFASVAFAAEPVYFDKPLKELMGAQEFAAAGLESLTPAQLARLESWLEKHAAQRGEKVAAEVEAKVEQKVKERAEAQGFKWFSVPTAERIESRVVGRVSALRGKGQLLTLENGQVWKITESVSRRIEIDSPKVYLRASSIGNGYLMTLQGYSADIRVERVK